MALYAVNIKRKKNTDRILSAVLVDSKTLERLEPSEELLIELMLSGQIKVENLKVEMLGSDKYEYKVTLTGSHNNNGSNYMISKRSYKDIIEENLCIVVNGWNGIYECIYSTGFMDERLVQIHRLDYNSSKIERIIASVDGIKMYLADRCKEDGFLGLRFFNAIVSKSRHFGELKQLDIAATLPTNIECFGMQSMAKDKKRFNLFGRKNNKAPQSYYDYGYSCDCNKDALGNKLVFELARQQEELMRQSARVHGSVSIPVFNLFNGHLNMIAIFGDCGPTLRILQGIERMDLQAQDCRSVRGLVVSAPRGIDIVRAPYGLDTIIIVAKVNELIRIRSPFNRSVKQYKETLKYNDVLMKDLGKKVGFTESDVKNAEKIILNIMSSNVNSRNNNVAVEWYMATDPEISVRVVKGIQVIKIDSLDFQYIYVIGV